MDVQGWSHSRTWDGDPRHVARARDFVARHLVGHGLPHLVDAAQMVVSELSTNAVRHTGTPFTVTVRCHDGSLLILVSDGSSTEPRLQTATSLPTSGMGLHVVEALSHTWGVLVEPTGGKSVWARFEVAEAP